MAIPDLLWACPHCGRDRGLQGSPATCRECGARFERATGAAIRATLPDGSTETLEPRAWLDRLPDPETVVLQALEAGLPIRRAAVRCQWVEDFDSVHGETGYLNRIEIWGEEKEGELSLEADAVVYRPGGGEADRWPLETLTAVQASSSSLQLNRRRAPLVSFRFDDDSVFLWELLVREALRRFYRRSGRGEIQEFQPRIEAR